MGLGRHGVEGVLSQAMNASLWSEVGTSVWHLCWNRKDGGDRLETKVWAVLFPGAVRCHPRRCDGEVSGFKCDGGG